MSAPTKEIKLVLPPPGGPIGLPIGEFLTVQQIAMRWKVSTDKVRRVFARELGVLLLPSEGATGKRRYITMRIPRQVLQRVELKYSIKSTEEG